MAKEIANYKKTRYDHENDPEGKYVSTDYHTVDNEKIYNDCLKYIDVLEDMDYKDDDAYGDIYRNHNKLANTLKEFRYNFKDMRAAEYKILKPMGLTFDTAENPMEDFNAKLEVLHEQLAGIEDSKPERVERFRKELESQVENIKTVKDRIDEFATQNPAMLSKFLIAPMVQKPHELAPPSEEMILSEQAQEILKDMPLPVEETIAPVAEVDEETPIDAATPTLEEIETTTEDILQEIEDLKLAMKYADPQEKKLIKQSLAALKQSLEYA